MQMDNMLEGIHKRIRLLEWAAKYPGSPRERLVSLAEAEELCCGLYPEHDRVVCAVRAAAQVRPGRPECNGPMRQAENRLIDLIAGLVDEAAEIGELRPPAGLRTEQVALGLWTLGFGRRAVIGIKGGLPLSIQEGFRVTRGALNLLADCLEWRPLSTEWDYRITRGRVRLHFMKDQAAGSRQEELLARREQGLQRRSRTP